MSQLCFLIDENTPDFLVNVLRAAEPGMDVVKVGEPGAPPRGTLDPELLIAAEVAGRCFITLDRRSMPGHLADHFAAGHHTCGVILLRGGLPVGQYAQEILLI